MFKLLLAYCFLQGTLYTHKGLCYCSVIITSTIIVIEKVLFLCLFTLKNDFL